MRLDMHSRKEIYKAEWKDYRSAGKKERVPSWCKVVT
jgi:hypothetical protein